MKNIQSIQVPVFSPKKRLLTLSEVAVNYRVGRRFIKSLIARGQLPVVHREPGRGGQPSQLLRVEDCERVLAQIK